MSFYLIYLKMILFNALMFHAIEVMINLLSVNNLPSFILLLIWATNSSDHNLVTSSGSAFLWNNDIPHYPDDDWYLPCMYTDHPPPRPPSSDSALYQDTDICQPVSCLHTWPRLHQQHWQSWYSDQRCREIINTNITTKTANYVPAVDLYLVL